VPLTYLMDLPGAVSSHHEGSNSGSAAASCIGSWCYSRILQVLQSAEMEVELEPPCGKADMLTRTRHVHDTSDGYFLHAFQTQRPFRQSLGHHYTAMEVFKESLPRVRFEYETTLATEPLSVFYSMRTIEGINMLEAYYRVRYDWRALGRCYVSPDTWKIIRRSDGPVALGEDPRTLSHMGKNYVVDNTWGCSALLCPDQNFRRIMLPSSGRNYTLISHGSKVLCVEWMKPLRVHECEDLHLGVWNLVISQNKDPDVSYRGGTVGYPCIEEGVYFGFGHKTTQNGSVTRHVPFLWILDTNGWTVTTKDLDAPCFAHSLVDPTSVVMHAGKMFLVTAESEMPWFQPQEYHTCIYRMTI
jgi:hypothetical protein